MNIYQQVLWDFFTDCGIIMLIKITCKQELKSIIYESIKRN
jgi:hypothetical protein